MSRAGSSPGARIRQRAEGVQPRFRGGSDGAAAAERPEREAGFTLIELMVVVLLIAILIAIAIPTFLGARSRAQDRAAQSNLRNA